MLTIPGVGFEIPLSVLVPGAIAGMTYGLLGVGLTLVFRTDRTLNFAHGQTGSLVASLVPILILRYHLPWAVGIVAAILAAAAFGFLTERWVVHKLELSSRLIVLVATLGLSQVLFVVEALIPRSDLAGSTYPLPFDTVLRFGDVVIGPGSILVLLVSPVLVVALHLLLTRTRIGLASRAAAENREVALANGIPVRQVAIVIWVAAAVLAGVAGILSGPTRPVVTTTAIGPILMVRGLGAALLGGFGRFRTVFLAGVGIGAAEVLVVWNYPVGGPLEVAMLAVVLGALFFRRELGQAVRGGQEASWSLASALRPLPARVLRHPKVVRWRRIALAVLLVAAWLFPVLLDNSQRFTFSTTVLAGLMGLSLVVVTGMAGQISLGQFAFVSVGAVVGGKLSSLGYPAPASMVYATVVGGLVAVVVGLPALRIRGVFLAVTTLSFAVATNTWLFRQTWLVVDDQGETTLFLPRPTILGLDLSSELAYTRFCIVALVVVSLAVHRLRTTGIGRSIQAVRDNEAGAASFGVPPARTKLTAFALSGMIAAFAGHLYAGLLVNFSVQPETLFGADQSLTMVGTAIFGGVTSIAGVIVGAVWFQLMDSVFSPLFNNLVSGNLSLLFAGGGLLFAVLQYPSGVIGALAGVRDRILVRLTGGPIDELVAGERALGGGRAPLPAAPPRPALDDGEDDTVPALAAERIVVRYGGIVAVDDVSIHVRQGEIVGLIGPNGAGKTTLFDVLTGRIRPDAGRVLLGEWDITALRPEERALAGIGRTFQQARLFDELRLVEVFEVALERTSPSELVPSILGLPPSRRMEAAKEIRAGELIDLLGLTPFRDRPVRELSTGTRRLAELGCQIALGAPVLLLDEPTAGVAQREVEAFRPVLREMRDHLDATIVVIDHDLPMVVDLADRVYVLAAGKVIAEGVPEAIRDDPAVVAAYLGTDDRFVARSGPASGPRQTQGVGQ